MVEEELREQNEALATAREMMEMERRRYQELFDLAPDGYLVTDASGRIREANRAAAALLNVPCDRLVGKLLVNFIPVRERPPFRTALNGLRETDRLPELDVALRARGGARREGSLTALAVRHRTGAIVAVRWLLRDVSERRRLDELRRRAETLAEADRLKSALLSVVSHDLKTPLAAMAASIAGLKRRLAAASVPPGVGEALAGIEAGNDRLTTFVGNLLDLTRMDAGVWRPAREWHYLEEILGTVLARFGAADAERIRACLPAELPMVYVDGVQVAQVFWNILDNAIKYAPAGTLIEVTAQPAAAPNAPGAMDTIQVTIRDRGSAIDAEEAELIFQPFYRGKAREDKAGAHQFKASGSGLGLAICRGLVEAHGGRIWVESAQGPGVSFHFTLPSPADGSRPSIPSDEPNGRDEE